MHGAAQPAKAPLEPDEIQQKLKAWQESLSPDIIGKSRAGGTQSVSYCDRKFTNGDDNTLPSATPCNNDTQGVRLASAVVVAQLRGPQPHTSMLWVLLSVKMAHDARTQL
jgi:hypothetical protein